MSFVSGLHRRNNAKKAPRWQKNLYENHGLPDNYTSASFLLELRRNVNPKNVTVFEALNVGASLTIQVCIVTLFVNVFVWLDNDWTTPDEIFMTSAISMIIGYLVYTLHISGISNRLPKDLRTAVIFLAFGYILSPILKTLTDTISTDTIYAMTIFMFLIHLIFGKYGVSRISLSDSLSMTSSIFGSLMLASRLASPLHALSLLTVSVQCFVLLPFLLSLISNYILISILLATSTLYLLLFLSSVLSCVFVLVTLFVHLVCPFWYVKWQKYKDNIYGPWDEAVIST